MEGKENLVTAPIFNIQSYCIHDGPGIRTTVFVKGCPLRCRWCQNPESFSAKTELMFYEAKCKGCGICEQVCPAGAVTMRNGIPAADPSVCTGCGACVDACRYDARETAGKEMSVDEVMEKVLSEKIFLMESGGGLTVSGGEALFHPEFTEELCRKAQQEGLHTAVETSCFASRDVVTAVFQYLDLAMIDIKHMDSALHRTYTGVPNEPIHANIKYIVQELKKPVIFRYPVIPSYNDDFENVRATADFVRRTAGEGSRIDLLPYHNLGNAKRRALGRKDEISLQSPSQEKMNAIADIMEKEFQLCVHIGG